MFVSLLTLLYCMLELNLWKDREEKWQEETRWEVTQRERMLKQWAFVKERMKKEKIRREKKICAYWVEKHCWLLWLSLSLTHGWGQLPGTPLLVSKFSSTDWTDTRTHTKNWLKLSFYPVRRPLYLHYIVTYTNPDQKPSLHPKNFMVWLFIPKCQS